MFDKLLIRELPLHMYVLFSISMVYVLSPQVDTIFQFKKVKCKLYYIELLHFVVHIVINDAMYRYCMNARCSLSYVCEIGIGPSPAAGQIDPKAIARQAIMK